MPRPLLAVIFCLFIASVAAAEEKPQTVLSIEDNMGFVGTAWHFELRSDGTWTLQRRFPPAERGKHEGKLTEKEVDALMKDLEKAGAFDAKAKDIEPRDPRVADGAYFTVTKLKEGKRFPLTFKREGPTSKAVKARLDKLAPAKAEE